MELFLSAEVEQPASGAWAYLSDKIRRDLDFLKNKNYGEEFTDIGIITILVSKKMIDDGFGKERKLIKRKSNEADIRLRIDFEKFVESDIETMRKLYIKNIIESIRVVGSISKGDFNAKKLESDILQALKVTAEQIEEV